MLTGLHSIDPLKKLQHDELMSFASVEQCNSYVNIGLFSFVKDSIVASFFTKVFKTRFES